MANNCADGVYNIKYTDNTKNPIVVNKQTLIQDVLDITLLGKSRKEYGEIFDENILHLLENFASPENPNNPGNPDLSKTISNMLENPIQGQIWYNTTQLRLFVYDGQQWSSLSTSSDIGGNSGIIAHGQQLPRPISPVTGYEFSYDECSWIVSPFNFPSEIDYMVCYTDSTALVTSEYRIGSNTTTSSGYAFYQIIGIKNNNNEGTDDVIVPPLPSPTPQPNVSQTPLPSIGATVSPTAAITPTVTKTPATTPTRTPAASPSPAPTRTPLASPTPTITPTASITALKGTLYITPSKGYPSGTNTEIPNNCVTSSLSDAACFATLGLVIQGLSGGVPPYTVDFSNVTFSSSITNTSTGTSIPSKTTYSYIGASGASTSAIRTGATSTTTLQMSAIISETSTRVACSNGSWSLGIVGGSRVIISDSAGRSLTLYTPSGLNGNVYGTSYTTPQSAYSDSYLSVPSCGGSGGGCVTIDSIFPDGNTAESIEVGNSMDTTDPYDFFNSGRDEVTYATTNVQPCVRITTESGASLVCSLTAPIPTLDNGYMLAPTLLNRSVPVMRHNITKWEKITSVKPAGDRQIRHITVNNRCFWAGETADAFILHHNEKSAIDP